MNKNTVTIIVSLLALIIIPFTVWGIISFSQRGTEHISLVVVPADSLVEVDNKQFKGSNSIRLKPGKYSVTVSKDGFQSDKQDLIVEESKDATFISLLSPTSEEAKRWVEKNQSAYLTAEGKASSLATQQGEEFIKRHPITQWLPLQKATYVIGYRQAEEETNQELIITIDASEGYREAALQEIRDRDLDPSDYMYEFSNYRNPFNE